MSYGTDDNGDPVPLELESYQADFLADESPIVIYLKARQIGQSFVIALEATAKSQLDKHLSIICSVGLDDAREKIMYCREAHRSVNPEYREELTIDNVQRLGFANGSRIIATFIPRGKGPADVYLDEFAFMRDPQEILSAAYGAISRGGRIVISSTLFGNSGFAYEMLTGDSDDEGIRSIPRIYIYWWQSMALCVDVEEATKPVLTDSGDMSTVAAEMTTEERVETFATDNLKAIFSTMLLEDFQQEFEIKPQKSESSFIPWDLISNCAANDLPEFVSYEHLKTKIKGYLYVGVDIGRRKDTTEIFLLESVGNMLVQRGLITLANMPFDQQKTELFHLLQTLPVAKIAIDETGMGMNLAEDVQRQYRNKVLPINFASTIESDVTITKVEKLKYGKKRVVKKKERVKITERMSTDLRILMEAGGLAIIRDTDLMRQIHSIKRFPLPNGGFRYDTAKNESHHADKYWALALAVHATKQETKSSGFVPPTFG